MSKMFSISLLREKPRTAVFMQGGPALIPERSGLLDRFAAAKADAAAFSGMTPESAVAVIPSSHTLQMRRELLREAEKSGLKTVRFLTAPAAVALMDAYRNPRLLERGAILRTLIVSLSGGFFDAAAVDLSGGVVEILSTSFAANATAEKIEKAVRRLLAAPELSGVVFRRVVMVGESSRIPGIRDWIGKAVSADAVYCTYSEEAAALGGAVQCAVLEGQLVDWLLLDVWPYSLGIRTEGGDFTPVIRRNTTIPVRETKTFTNARPNQTEYQVWVYEGEGENAAENALAGMYRITGATPCPAGTAQIELSLDLDATGFLRLDAKDPATGKKLKLDYSSADNGSWLKLPGQKETQKEQPPVSEQELVLKFLPVYDDLQLALEQPTSDEAFKKGVRLTLKRLTGIFREQGVEFYGERGEPFDPRIHNAVMHICSAQYAENTIVKVLQKGVKHNGKILRFAMVQVAN